MARGAASITSGVTYSSNWPKFFENLKSYLSS